MPDQPTPLAGCTCLAIDPGPERSGFCRIADGRLVRADAEMDNGDIVTHVEAYPCYPAVVESVECYGMAVGESTFRTCETIGRIRQVAGDRFVRMARREVKLHLCNSSRATDANIWRVLVDRWGGRDAAIGWNNKKRREPGPLYFIHKHARSALALAVTWWETRDA